MSKKKKIIIAVVVFAIVAVLVIVNLQQSSGKTFTVQAEKAELGRLVQIVGGSGRIQPKLAVKISANVSAKITKLHVEEGDAVNDGQVLVELDRTRYEAAAVQANASLSFAKATARRQKATMDRSKSEYDRQLRLFEQGLASQGELDRYKATYEVDKASHDAALDQVTQSEAVLDQAKDDLSKTTLHSPIVGVVTQLNKEEGEIALGSQFQEDVIMVVSDLSNMEAVTEIDENDVVNIALGDSARIRVDAFPDTSFEGRITEIAHTARTRGLGTQEEVTNFDVKITVIDRIGNVRPGMSATVDIITDVKSNALRIPIQAVTVREVKEINRWLRDKEAKTDTTGEATNEGSEDSDEEDLKEIVFVVEEDIAKVRFVKTGISSDTHIEILEGVDEGETVVTGSYRILSKELRHDAEVKVEKSRTFESKSE
ncbi:MAG: efflux RND transporter periplasmic adaptor subunit [bacterium]